MTLCVEWDVKLYTLTTTNNNNITFVIIIVNGYG